MQVTSDGMPAVDMFVSTVAQTTGREIIQGKTVRSSDPEFNGAIVLRGANSGDRVLVSKSDDPYGWISADSEVPAGLKRGDFTVDVRPISGDLSFVPLLAFVGADAFSLSLDAAPLAAVSSQSVSVDVTDEAGDSVPASVAQAGNLYTVDLVAATVSRAPFSTKLTAKDEGGREFFVPAKLELLQVGDLAQNVRTDLVELELHPDDIGALDRVAVFSSSFPVSRSGLPDSVARVTPTFAIAGFPTSASIAGDMTLQWSHGTVLASVEDAVNVYQWNGSWQLSDTRASIDTTNQAVTAHIPGAGTYAAFLDLTRTTMVGTEEVDPGGGVLQPTDGLALSYYPGPFETETTIEIVLAAGGHLLLDVFDVLGRKVATLIDEPVAAGVTHVTFDGSDLTAGVYFARVRVAGTDDFVRHDVVSMVKGR
jgi:hypothetical protein